jgi:small subunit ribosomal protein S2e|tara:strand:- start:442 stop:1125 length:684 start_codon:yes stop_codon:yes gene_type:complete
VTKLGRMCKDGRIKSINDLFKFSLAIKEFQIVDHFLPTGEEKGQLADEVMKIMPVQKQTKAGQRTRFKAFIAVGDRDGHIGLGSKCSAEVANAIRGAIINAKINICPVRRGYWGAKVGNPHTIPNKVTGKCGSVRVRLIPAPRGTGLVAAPCSKKMLKMAGLADCYTSARGHTRTCGNFAKACFFALKASYAYLTPDMWTPTVFKPEPLQEHTDWLQLTEKKEVVLE